MKPRGRARGGRGRVAALLAASLMMSGIMVFLVPVDGVGDSAYKVPTANPTFARGARVSGNFANVQASDNTYMGVREGLSGGVRYLDMTWSGWQAFAEAARNKLVDIEVELEGYQTRTDDSWYLRFYDYNANAWDATWRPLGMLPTMPDGTLRYSLGDRLLAQRFVGAAGQFRLRVADGNTVLGGADALRTVMYIDLLRARFVYDITPPSSNVVSPEHGSYTNATSLTVRGTASDPSPDASGVASVEVSLDGGLSWEAASPVSPGDYTSWDYLWDSIPGEGVYVIRCRAADAAANVETPAAGNRIVVDWTPPQVAGTSPADGDINVNVGASVQARFLEANGIDPASLDAAAFTLVDEEGAAVAGSVSYDAGTLTATFEPDGDLFYGYTYTATLSAGVRDLAGNPLPGPYSWTFRTADILSLSLSETYNRDGTPGGGSVGFGTMSPEESPFVVGGGTPPYAVRLRVLSSTPWNIMARADSDLEDDTQTPPAVIPVSRLQWSLAGAGDWRPFDLAGVEMFSPARDRTPQPGGGNVDLDLMLTLDWEDAPGDYAAQVVFVLIEQP